VAISRIKAIPPRSAMDITLVMAALPPRAAGERNSAQIVRAIP
jgi:hypothetical protein